MMRTITKFIRTLRAGNSRILVTLVLALLVITLGSYSIRTAKTKEGIVYAQSLDEVVATVDGEELSLRDLAFYVAFVEDEIRVQALLYDEEDPNRYWNIHTQDGFISIEAREMAMESAIHDTIFCGIAMREGILLSEEEEQRMQNTLRDVWWDWQQNEIDVRLGITYEDLEETLREIALAQKMQDIYAVIQGEEYEAFDYKGEAYQKLKEEHTYSVNDKVWERVSFGNVTL